MNVLFINTVDTGGGAAGVAQSLRRALKERAERAPFFVAIKHGKDSDVRIIPRPFWRKALGFLLGTEKLILSDWLLDTPEFKDADLVHCHNLHGRYFNLETLEKMARLKPVIWTLHDEWSITPHCANTLQSERMIEGLFACPSIDTPPRLLWDNSRRLAQWKSSLYAHLAGVTVIAPSQWLLNRVARTPLGRLPREHIPNGIDTGIFRRGDQLVAREALGLPSHMRIVLILADDAVNNPWKGWAYAEQAAQAYAHDESVLFLSVGNHSERPDQDNITFRTYATDPSEVARYYQAADAFLFTSLAENFPLAVLEAMACGTPVVAFDVGGVKEAIEHRVTGFIAGYRNAEALAEGLGWALALPSDAREQLAEAGTARIKTDYDSDRMIDRYMALYNKLIATQP